ncbi:hypothetical protein DRO03_09300 [Methanosarcinales archaeon]|nr:MAG: hypothetical protein DRO03_09300 [Methanosarcinales archaeon]
MEKPIVSDYNPVKASLEAGKEYFYSTCGRSETQPFCDGSHSKFTAEDVGIIPE